jgi:hypothetical protein
MTTSKDKVTTQQVTVVNVTQNIHVRKVVLPSKTVVNKIITIPEKGNKPKKTSPDKLAKRRLYKKIRQRQKQAEKRKSREKQGDNSNLKHPSSEKEIVDSSVLPTSDTLHNVDQKNLPIQCDNQILHTSVSATTTDVREEISQDCDESNLKDTISTKNNPAMTYSEIVKKIVR